MLTSFNLVTSENLFLIKDFLNQDSNSTINFVPTGNIETQ